MVALQHGVEDEVPPEDDVVDAARAAVDRLGAGLSNALLAATPDDVRRLAARAAAARGVAERRRARAGERPTLDADADAEVTAAVRRYREACAARHQVADERNRLLAIGNVAAVGALAVGGALVAIGTAPMAFPVALCVVASPVAPATAAALASTRAKGAQRAMATARTAWVEALEGAGVSTMGALRARRLAVRAWQRLDHEAALAEDAARPHVRAWHVLAGPGVDPADVEALLDRVAELRAAQLRLLAALLARRAAVSVAERAVADAAEDDEARPSSWFDDALERIRGRRFPTRAFG